MSRTGSGFSWPCLSGHWLKVFTSSIFWGKKCVEVWAGVDVCREICPDSFQWHCTRATLSHNGDAGQDSMALFVVCSRERRSMGTPASQSSTCRHRVLVTLLSQYFSTEHRRAAGSSHMSWSRTALGSDSALCPLPLPTASLSFSSFPLLLSPPHPCSTTASALMCFSPVPPSLVCPILNLRVSLPPSTSLRCCLQAAGSQEELLASNPSAWLHHQLWSQV